MPKYLCGTNLGQMTVSTLYEISVRFDVADGYTYENVNGGGELSGWGAIYLNNPQTPYQNYRMIGTTTKEFFTYVFDIIATIQGNATPGGGHLWVPRHADEVRLYVKRYKEVDD